MWTRRELKERAKERMRKNYSIMLLVSLIVLMLDGSVFNIVMEFKNQVDVNTVNSGELIPFQDSIITYVLPFFIVGSLLLMAVRIVYDAFIVYPFIVGEQKFYLENRKDREKINNLLYAFQHHYLHIVKIMFIMYLKLLLWTLLLFIPGIVKSYEYSMIPYILAENPNISTKEAFALSKQLTADQKMEMFILDLSFLGWQLLGVLLCGIGIVFVVPYRKATAAELYVKLKEIKHISFE